MSSAAIVQYGDTSAFMEEDQVVVLRPALQPAQFTYSDGRTLPQSLTQSL